MPKTNIPNYRLHKATGQAFIELQGKRFYLGKHGSKASKIEYERLLGEYLSNNRQLPPTRGHSPGITIAELMIQFLEWAKSYYVKNGKVTDTFTLCRLSVNPVVLHYGKKSVSDFGPLSLKFIREKMIESNLTRKHINKRVAIIKQAFKWGVENEQVPAEVYQALQAVSGLKVGRTAARDNPPVEPVADEIVEKTLPFLSSIIRDMVLTQRLTGMRPGEVCNLRACDIQKDGDVWSYKPHSHKMEHYEKTRMLPIGPRAQKILYPYLVQREEYPELPIFSPIDTLRFLRAERRQNRKTKVQPSQSNRAKANPKRTPRDRYDSRSYNRAIQRGCEKAGIESWSPNQLRHSAGTEIADKFGLLHAKEVLGHSSVRTTERFYVAPLPEKAIEVAKKIG